MRKTILFCILTFVCITSAFSNVNATSTISEYSSEYYPDIYFTLSTNFKLSNHEINIRDNGNKITNFSFYEESKTEAVSLEVLIISEGSCDEMINGLSERIEGIHENINVNCITHLSTPDFINETATSNTEMEPTIESTLNVEFFSTNTDLKAVPAEFIYDSVIKNFTVFSEGKLLIYVSNGENCLTGTATEESLDSFDDLAKKLIDDSGVLCLEIQREDLTASDTVEALFEDIYNAAFKTNYDYLISYNAPLSIMSKSDHSTVVKTLGNLKAGFTYVLDYSGTENFIYDIDASQYPLISFSYYKDDHHYNLNMMNLYENLTRNKKFGFKQGESKKIDLVFVLENTVYSKYYYLYFLDNIETILETLNEAGYSVRIGLVSYNDIVRVHNKLILNFEDVFVNLKSFTYGGGTYSFISPIEAIIKASELDYRSDASKNIIFVQNSDTFSYDKCESFNFEEIIKALLDKNINFYGITNNNFFYDLSYRVPGKTADLTFDVMKLVSFFVENQRIEFISKYAEVGKKTNILLFDNKNIIKTNFLLNASDLKSEFRINSITASPFIARKGEEVILNCKTWPVDGVEFRWYEADNKGSENFKDGNGKSTVSWIAPLKSGYYTLNVEAKYTNYLLEGQVVVLVE